MRTGRFEGLQVLARIRPGTVAVNPEDACLYFFVPCGSVEHWPKRLAADCRCLSALPELPSARQLTPPGTYWLVPPVPEIRLTNPHELREALSDLLPDWTER